MDKLKRCPFCGSEAKVAGANMFCIICPTCLSSSRSCASASEAVKAWNSRVSEMCFKVWKGCDCDV